MTVTRITSQMIAVACIASAFAVGFITAKWSESDQKNNPAKQSNSSINNRPIQRNTTQVIEGQAWKTRKEQLIQKWEVSPSVYYDFPLHEETRAILEKVPISELEKWFLEINSFLAHNDECGIKLKMQYMVFLVLAHRSPERLIQLLAVHSEEASNFSIEEALSIWIKKDPLSVLKWLENADIPEILREDVDDCVEEALVKLAVSDPAEFEKRIAKVTPEVRESILQDYAYETSVASGRAAILGRAASSDHAEAMALWKGLLLRESKIHPEKAYKTLNQLTISEVDRMTLDLKLVEWTMSSNTDNSDRGVEFMQTWLERNPQRSVPVVMLEFYIKWFGSDAHNACDWVAKRLSEERYNTFVKFVIEQRINDNDEDYPLFAKLADQITDSSTRTASLRLVKNSWHSKNPSAANEWQRTLSEEDQVALK